MPISVPTQNEHLAVADRVTALEALDTSGISARLAALDAELTAIQAEVARLDARLDAIAAGAQD